MSKKIDLTGQRFGKWTVLHEGNKNKNATMWYCKCDCGKEKDVCYGTLVRGTSTSCGCSCPGQVKDMTGQRFGRLQVVSQAPKKTYTKQIVWKCICDCGNSIDVVGGDLRSGKVKSCGCYNREKLIDCNLKHGRSKTRLYRIWSGIKARTTCETNHAYERYGGKGITICEEWKNNFLKFEKWAYENGYNDNLTIDRINNEDGYKPDNCRWSDYYVQANNTSKNVYIKKDNEIHTLAEWCRILHLSYSMVCGRLKRGWSADMLFIPPVRKKKGVNHGKS